MKIKTIYAIPKILAYLTVGGVKVIIRIQDGQSKAEKYIPTLMNMTESRANHFTTF